MHSSVFSGERDPSPGSFGELCKRFYIFLYIFRLSFLSLTNILKS